MAGQRVARRSVVLALVAALAQLATVLPARAAEVRLAAAGSFGPVLPALTAAFTRDTGHTARVTTGATGKLYAQIVHGAPFEVLLAADAQTPEKLERLRQVVPGTRRTIAHGRLVLWSPDPARVDAAGAVLRQGRFRKLAVANAKVAPYGAAAEATLRKLGLFATLKPRLVYGESVAQAWQFVASGNAELGLVALAQVMQDGKFPSGSAWTVPADLHPPLRQDVALLARGRDRPAAVALVAWLRGPQAAGILRRFGYDVP